MTGAVCKCGAPADLRRGTSDLCNDCWGDILESFSAAAWNPLFGFGVQVGQLAPEHGEGFAHLRCSSLRCSATWVGRCGEACGYCPTRHHVAADTTELEAAERAVRDHFLTAPARYQAETRPDYAHRLNEWGRAMNRAVQAGIIPKADAMEAWRLAVRNFGT